MKHARAALNFMFTKIQYGRKVKLGSKKTLWTNSYRISGKYLHKESESSIRNVGKVLARILVVLTTNFI